MSLSDAERTFAAAVESWVGTALAERRHDFGSLVRALPGVDPIVALAALERLSADATMGPDANALVVAARSAAPTARETDERPLPHPLEFYWRNTDASLELFRDLVAGHGPETTIAYLGMPNVFRLARQSLPDRRHVVIDRSIPRMDALDAGDTAIRLDVLRQDPPALGVDAVVSDPPWYPEHLRAFLWAAARLLRPGGSLYAGLPPDGTRPGVVRERHELFGWARSAGLELIEYRSGALRYISPAFELASHRAAGIGGVPLDWRTGDLAVLRRVNDRQPPRPPLPDDEVPWLTYAIDEIPVWIRDRHEEASVLGKHLLSSVVDGDVLTTVSRRDPLRARVDVWTSLNRVYSTSHPAALQAICRALASGELPSDAVAAELQRPLEAAEREAVAIVAALLKRIVAAERVTHGIDHE